MQSKGGEKSNGAPAGAGPIEDNEEVLRLAEHFAYLDELRESGVTNMFGARPYLMRARCLSPVDAASVLSSWMKSDLSTPPDARARAALSKAES